MLDRLQRHGLPDESAPSGFSAFTRYGALLVVKNRDLYECTVTTIPRKCADMCRIASLDLILSPARDSNAIWRANRIFKEGEILLLRPLLQGRDSRHVRGEGRCVGPVPQRESGERE